jgi:nitronate monooxygenase
MLYNTKLTRKIGIQFPVIQAPMAGGATTPELVAAVSNNGGLGSLGAGYMTADEIRAAIIKIRELTDKPFSVNLFISEKHRATESAINQMCHWIEQSCSELKTKINPVAAPFAPSFEDQMKVVVEENVPVLSFAFGVLDVSWVKELKSRGIFLIGTATTVAEACLLEECQIDAIVAQGSEAGGHRSTFIGKAEDALFGVEVLVKQFLENVKIPVIAAGGIMEAEGIVSALALGAEAVQMGTAFLSCYESGINSAYRQALLDTTQDNTVLTRVFSGKMARGLSNKFIERMQQYQKDILEYPIQNALTRSMRKAAEKQGNADFMSMWAGQSVYLSQACSAAEFLEKIIYDVELLLKK